MFKFKFYLIFIFFLITSSLSSNEKVFIAVSVDDNIITNIDIEKEIEYLKILNPNLLELDNKSTYEIAKKSLINEIIKKKEITKFTNFKRDNPLEDAMLKNLYIE